jgi:hypothetical protein
MPIRTIILRVEQEEFEAYEAFKQGKESWESMYRRELLQRDKKEG